MSDRIPREECERLIGHCFDLRSPLNREGLAAVAESQFMQPQGETWRPSSPYRGQARICKHCRLEQRFKITTAWEDYP